MEACSEAQLYQLVKEPGTQSMPGKSAPFLTKAEYHSSQSPQWPEPGCKKMFLKKGKAKTGHGRKDAQAAGPICRPLKCFFFTVALIEYVLKSHSFHLRGKLSSLPVRGKKKSIREREACCQGCFRPRAEPMEAHNLNQSLPEPPTKINVGRKSGSGLGRRGLSFGAVYQQLCVQKAGFQCQLLAFTYLCDLGHLNCSEPQFVHLYGGVN